MASIEILRSTLIVASYEKNGYEARHLRELNELGSFHKKHMFAVAGDSLLLHFEHHGRSAEP
jgi:hypothetical protein